MRYEMLVHHKVTYPPSPSISIDFLDNWYPFTLLGGEGHCERTVSCPRTQHSDLPGAEPGPVDLQGWVVRKGFSVNPRLKVNLDFNFPCR